MHFSPYLLRLPARLFQELSVFTSNYNSSSKLLEFIQFLFSNPDLTLISSLTAYCSARMILCSIEKAYGFRSFSFYLQKEAINRAHIMLYSDEDVLERKMSLSHAHRCETAEPPVMATSPQRPLFWADISYFDCFLNLCTTATSL